MFFEFVFPAVGCLVSEEPTAFCFNVAKLRNFIQIAIDYGACMGHRTKRIIEGKGILKGMD
jgi:hypothetical protein